MTMYMNAEREERTERTIIEIPTFVSENARKNAEARKLLEMKKETLRKERQRVKKIKARRRAKAIILALFLFAGIGATVTVKYGINRVQNEIEEYPVKVSAPEGYTKVYRMYTFQYGDTFDGLIYDILTENSYLQSYYRFQDYKAELWSINKSIVNNPSVIKSGTTIVYPVFQEIEE